MSRKSLKPVHPNAGLAAAYRRKLRALIEDMHDSTLHWIKAAWRKEEPATLALDAATPNLKRAIRLVRRRWEDRFDDAADQLAVWFSQAINKRSSAQLRKILRDGGWTVRFKMTPAMREILDATIAENVGLIRTIPRKYLDDVEGAVMRSVQAGRDLATLTDEIEAKYGLTRKRAALIARDQNNKATGAMVLARQIEAGLSDGIWQHSHAGKEPRPTHVRMDGKKFKLAKGMYDSAEKRYVRPGELINCRCTSRPFIPGIAT